MYMNEEIAVYAAFSIDILYKLRTNQFEFMILFLTSCCIRFQTKIPLPRLVYSWAVLPVKSQDKFEFKISCEGN